MNTRINRQEKSVSGPLLAHIMRLDQANRARFVEMTTAQKWVGSKPLAASDSFQDPGGGYNTNLTFPQR